MKFYKVIPRVILSVFVTLFFVLSPKVSFAINDPSKVIVSKLTLPFGYTDKSTSETPIQVTSPGGTVTITAPLVYQLRGSTITYTGVLTYCNGVNNIYDPVLPAGVPTSGGTWSQDPVGLALNPFSGELSSGASSAGTYTVSYTYTTTNAGTSTTTIYSIQVNSKFSPRAQIALPPSICTGNSGTLTGTVTAFGSGTWSMTFSDNASINGTISSTSFSTGNWSYSTSYNLTSTTNYSIASLIIDYGGFQCSAITPIGNPATQPLVVQNTPDPGLIAFDGGDITQTVCYLTPPSPSTITSTQAGTGSGTLGESATISYGWLYSATSSPTINNEYYDRKW